jgi:hypothetical protein
MKQERNAAVEMMRMFYRRKVHWILMVTLCDLGLCIVELASVHVCKDNKAAARLGVCTHRALILEDQSV